MRLSLCWGLNGRYQPPPRKKICPPGTRDCDLIWKEGLCQPPPNTPLRVGLWSSLLRCLSCPWTQRLPSRLSSRAAMGAFQPPRKGSELPATPALRFCFVPSPGAQDPGPSQRACVQSNWLAVCKVPAGQRGPREEPGMGAPARQQRALAHQGSSVSFSLLVG